ncbi:MAG: superoxide dismutase [Rickettsiaceae bacterium]|nr:superoxide dismutase [Rickettsiaceae bacterium]
MNKIFSQSANQLTSPFALPELPYSENALGPYMSKETFDYHHKKHHLAYVNNLNKLLEGNHNFKEMTLEQIVLASNNNNEFVGIFNNAAQIWNHSFFWHSIKPNGGGEPAAQLAEMINISFGNYENFANEFKAAGTSQFGSGWVWLVHDGSKLQIQKTSNAATPITESLTPLICCDVWEHAYYIDYKNNRAGFLDVFLNHLVNWDFALGNLNI